MKNSLKYFIYARKSSEQEDRQVASINSQIGELQRIAKSLGIIIVDVISEAKSAKEPEKRKEFANMIKRIEKGEANGILCWKLDRLARNPIDAGKVNWMLQKEVIKEIITFQKTFYPTDNVITLNVEFGLANQYIRDLSTNIKRAQRTKAEKGWFPYHPPIGYTHSSHKKGEKIIIPDTNFNLVRKMFDMLLSGQYNPAEIWETAVNNWNLKRSNGKPPARSTIYRIFSNPFYYGEYEFPKYSGNFIKGKHKKMITRDEFDRVQFILGDKVPTRKQSYDFTYRGPIKCSECGCLITAEKKHKRLKDGTIKSYIYYRCTKRKRGVKCSQKTVREENLEQQIVSVLKSIQLHPDVSEWCLNVLKRLNKENHKDREQILKDHRSNYDSITNKITNLIDMRADGELTKDEFITRKTKLLQEKERLMSLINDTDSDLTNWVEKAELLYNFAVKAPIEFNNSSSMQKKAILCSLGSNFFLEDKKLLIKGNNLVSIMRNFSSPKNAELAMLELGNPTPQAQKNTPDQGSVTLL